MKKVMKVQATTGNTKQMRRFLRDRLTRIKGVKWYELNGNIYATKGKATFYPCAVSHTDTVHSIYKNYCVEVDKSEGKDVLWAVAKVKNKWQQVGIGGDDKVGIYICLALLEKMPVMKAAFFRDEECGCVGSTDHDEPFFKDCGYILQADRRGAKDMTETINGMTMVSDPFKKLVEGVAPDRIWVDGMMTDVEALAKVHDVSMMNVSCGYYHPHTNYEYVVTDEVDDTLLLFENIIRQAGNERFECAHENIWRKYADHYTYHPAKKWWREYEQPNHAECPSCFSQTHYDDTINDYYCYGCGFYTSELRQQFYS